MTESTTKESYIRTACSNRNLVALRGLATSAEGFMNDELRRLAWPILLGSDVWPGDDFRDWRRIKKHGDEHQVGLDVNRSFVYYPKCMYVLSRHSRDIA